MQFWLAVKISRFLAGNWNLCNFGLFLPKFGCHGNSLENSGSTFEFTKPIKPHWTCEKFLDFLQETEICAILAYIFLNLVAMATRLVPLKIVIADPKSWLFMRKIPQFLAQNGNQCNFGFFLFKFRLLSQNWNLCNFGSFLPKYGCHGNSLGY